MENKSRHFSETGTTLVQENQLVTTADISFAAEKILIQ